jgi:hypothetical protein
MKPLTRANFQPRAAFGSRRMSGGLWQLPNVQPGHRESKPVVVGNVAAKFRLHLSSQFW